MAFLHHLRLLLFLSIICISYVCAQVLVSIDCGSSDSSYIDDNFISWTNDENYIKNGQSYTVQTSSSVSPVMSTLRAFPTRKKNCYAISEASKGDRVLVRASFFYGNYDGKSSPPSFDLQFDGNDWLTVETSSTELVYEEVIYTLRGDGLSVCVAQTSPGQVPFISALEVRALDSTMYKQIDANYPLGLVRRVGYGAKDIIRYSDDSYDRIWNPATPGNGLTSVASDAILISTSGSDQPPSSVLQNAIAPLSPTSSILLNLGFTTARQVPVYINMYFSEVTELDPTTQTRSFQVVMNNQPLLNDPVAPPYGSFQEVTGSNFTVSANTTLALVPVRGSTLPPIINAMELLVIGSPLSDGTNAKDVQGLASLKDAFDVLQDWNGDPCLPAPYSWDWINCSSDPVPRVTALYLNSFGLKGLLPDFSSMDALQTIDLHNNSLSGPIPDYLGTLPNLKQLNLGSNELSGSVPASITKKNNLNLVVTGNPNLCTSGNTCKVNSVNSPTLSAGDGGGGGGEKKSSSSKLPVILGITIPIFVIIWAVVGVVVVLRQRNKKNNSLAAANITGAPGPTVSQQASPSNPLIGKMGQSIFNEIKLNMDNNNNNNDDNNNNNNNNNNGDSD